MTLTTMKHFSSNEMFLSHHLMDVATRWHRDGGNPYKYTDRMFFDIASVVSHFYQIHYGIGPRINDRIMLQESL